MLTDALSRKRPMATPNDLVFVNELGNTIDRHKVTRTLKTMAERSDCSNKNVGSHVLRHTYASFLATHHIDLFIISQLLGHASTRTTSEVYARYLEEDDNEEITKLFDALWK